VVQKAQSEDNGMMDIDDEGGGQSHYSGIYSIIAICELEVLGLQIT
jgi:hypothetical protein